MIKTRYDGMFSRRITMCDISGKICQNNGICTECPTGYYYMTFDDDVVTQAQEAMSE